jgi:NADPH-dependent ferric siderophore reductase
VIIALLITVVNRDKTHPRLRSCRPGGTLARYDRTHLGILCPLGDVFAWIAGEASVATALRHYARVERGLERRKVDAIPYWKAGADEEVYDVERHHVMDEDEE